MTQTYPTPITQAMLAPAYVPVIAYDPGADGNIALGNESKSTTTDLTQSPRYHNDKARLWGNVPLAVDVTKPLGPIDLKTGYESKALSNPTVTSLTPNTGVHGAADV